MFIRFFIFWGLFFLSLNISKAQDNCESYTQVSLEQLASLLVKNDFQKIESLLRTLQSTCGEIELAARIQILQKIINKQGGDTLIKHYLDKKYDSKLVKRFDAAAEKDFNKTYQRSKEEFDFIPLRHPVDSLLKLKAAALINSNSFTLSKDEEAICLLFSDNIEQFYATMDRSKPARPTIDDIKAREEGKDRVSAVVYAGVFAPLGNNPYLRTSPTIGATVMTRLSIPLVFELGVKVRINSNNAYFDFRDNGEIKAIKGHATYFLGANMGYKALDRKKWILMPKIGAGLGFINTNLAKTTYYEGAVYDEDLSSGIRYNNVNTFHTMVGASIMRHIKRKMYIGLETAYHHVPYNMDQDLITAIDKNYGSIELFFRF